MKALQKKTEVTKSARSIASMYPDDPAKERAKQQQKLEGTARAAAVASAPELSGGRPTPVEMQPVEAAAAVAGSDDVQAPRPPSGKRQGGPARRQASASAAPAQAPPESSDRGSEAGSDTLAATLSDRDLIEADRLREKERARLKDERNKALQATVKEKQAAIGEAAERQRELTRQIQKLTEKLQKKESQLRSIQDLHRETENELLDRVDHLEAQLSSARHSGPGDQEALVAVSGGSDAVNLAGELQGALSRLMSTQEALHHRDADLTNAKKKVKVLKDKVALLERKGLDLEAAQEESAQDMKNMQAKVSRAENKLRVSEARVRELEDEAESKSTEALELHALVHQANDELQGRDEQGASLATKLQKAVAAVGQKAEEMERLKALLAVAHAENEKALELEHEVSKERRKALKSKKDAERADAKLAASNAKLAKRILEVDELKRDVADAETRVAAADQKVAQAKADMLTKDSVVDKAAADTAERLTALRDCEQEIRDLHAALDRHDVELADRDAKVTEAEEAVTAAWKFAKKGIQDVKADAAKQIAAVQATAAREVQKIKSDNVADEMLQSSFEAVKEADEQAQKVRNELKRSVVEAEKHRNTSVALLSHLEISRVEREQLNKQIRHCHDMLSKMFASVTEAAALKAELEQSQATVRAFKMRHAVAMTRMVGLEEQVRVLRDEDEKDGVEEEVDESQREEEIAAAKEIIDGNRTQLIDKVREWMQLEIDVDKIKGQKNKALEKAREADELSGRIQAEMIRSVAHAALDKVISDIEIGVAKEAQIHAEENQARAQALTDELNAETSQILEMLDFEKAGRARLEENLQHQIEDRELLMKAMQKTDTAMSGVKEELEEREEGLSMLQMQLEETQALVGASHARENALRKGMDDLRSVRVVDYIMSRPDLCPAALVTGHTNATGFNGGAAAAHAMVGAVKDAIGAYNKLVDWQKDKFDLSGLFSRPVPDEVNAWSPKFGVSPESESGLLWAVEEALAAPIVHPWVEKIREVEGQLLEDRIYYEHEESGVERTDHPLKDHYLELLAALRDSESAMAASFHKMQHGLGATPPTELVQEAWQVWVEDCVTELFQLAVRGSSSPRQLGALCLLCLLCLACLVVACFACSAPVLTSVFTLVHRSSGTRLCISTIQTSQSW
jgi:chromosome segregation ATPase